MQKSLHMCSLAQLECLTTLGLLPGWQQGLRVQTAATVHLSWFFYTGGFFHLQRLLIS